MNLRVNTNNTVMNNLTPCPFCHSCIHSSDLCHSPLPWEKCCWFLDYNKTLNLLDENGNFHSYYEILKELSKKWENKDENK